MTAKTPDASFGASNIVFGYNAMGQRTSMSDQSGVTTYAYDSRDRLVEKVNPVGVIQYAYDLQGNLTNLETQVSGFTSQVSYAYDVLNRLKTVLDPRTGLTAYNYDNVGNLQNFILPNGVSQVYRYDSLNRLTNVAVNSVTTPIESYRYTLGPSGHRLAVQEGHGRQVTYQYDNLYRLTRESILGASPLGDISYGFDLVGNRLAMTSTVFGIPSQVNTFDANDRLGSDSYDPNGNTTAATVHDSLDGTDTAFTYSYDFENRILSATSAVSAVQLAYDGDGNRVRKMVTDAFGTRTTRYLVDQNNLTGYSQVLEELDASNNVTVAFTVGLDVISQTRYTPTNEVTHYFGYDGHGNTRFLTDTNGTITDRWDYDAYGNIIARSGSTFNNLLYCGEYLDLDLGLYFLRARYMEPGRGRFWSADSFEGFNTDPITLHKYVYANANPMSFTDPSGRYSLIEASIVVFVFDTLASMARPSASGTCGGVDVTDLVATTLRKADELFRGRSWSDEKKKERCRSLWLPPEAAAAWDMNSLAATGHSNWQFSPALRGTRHCKDTVVFGGRCVYASAANYALFGKLMRLCFSEFHNYMNNPVEGGELVIGQKLLNVRRYGTGALIPLPQALAFYDLGYWGRTPTCSTPGCRMPATKMVAPPSGWKWGEELP